MQSIPMVQSLLAQKKEHEFTSLLAILAALWLVLSITGCSKKTGTAMSDTGTTAVAESTAVPPSAANPSNSGTLSDANIIASLSEADSAEIAEAKLVLTKSKNPEVKSFAKMMITDHSKMKAEKDDLAKKLNITPQPPPNDNAPSELNSEMSALNSAPNSHALDSIYITNAVADHTKDLADVKELQTKAQAPELRDAIKNAEPVVAKHLDHAKMIETKLSKESMAMGRNTR